MKKVVSILLSLTIIAAIAAVSSTVFADNNIFSDKINEPATGIENIDVWDDGDFVTEPSTEPSSEPSSEPSTEPATKPADDSTTTEEASVTEDEPETDSQEPEETKPAKTTTAKAVTPNTNKTSPKTGCDF